jgi:hypothetical protein
MNILDLLIPNTLSKRRQREEDERKLAAQQFNTLKAIPENFQTEQMPIPQMMPLWERATGQQWPTQPAERPVPGSTPPGTSGDMIQGPENLPIEYISPRSLEESSTRQTEITGRSDMAGKFAGAKYGLERKEEMRGMFPDAGDDIEGMDIPSTAGFQRYEPTKPGESQPPMFGEREWDAKLNAYVQSAPGEPDEWSPKASAGGGQGGANDQKLERAFAVRESASRIIDRFVDRVDPQKLALMKMLGVEAMDDPDVASMVRGKLSPAEQREIFKMMQQITWANQQINQLTVGDNKDPMGIR